MSQSEEDLARQKSLIYHRNVFLGLQHIRGSVSAAGLETQGWEAWYGAMFGQSFVDALAPHHREAVEWHWEGRMSLRRGEKPEYNAYFPIWSREHMKSAVARRMVVCDACLSVSEANPNEKGGYCLYVSRNKTMVLKHAVSIETLLTSPQIRKYYPTLSEVKRNVQGGSKGWQATFLNTKADFVFHFSGMDEGLAGGNVEDWRVTMMCLDDIDGREDSPVIAENRFTTLTTEILPMAQDGTLVFFAQNLISRYSTMYRIQKGHARVLTDRKPTVPVPAVLNMVTEVRTIEGVPKDIIVSGEPTWHLFDLEKCQDRMNREGLPAFLKERQHDVEQDKSGLVLQNWNDAVHVISRSEFASMYGTREIPQRWSKRVFNDWSRTKTAHHANVAGIVTTASQNSALPGAIFLFNPMSFPANSSPEDIAERLLSIISPKVKLQSGEFLTWADLIKSTLQKTDLERLIHDITSLIEARRSVLAQVLPQYVRPVLRAQNYNDFRGSHEQSKTGALFVYQRVFGLPFVATNPGGDGGVDTINLLQKVDYKKPHAFRPELDGYTNFYLVGEDDLSQPPKIVNGVEVYPPKPYNDALRPDDLHDEALIRYQFRNWRYRDPKLSEAGEKESELLKLNDDFGNGCFVAGTVVETQHGPRPIESIIAGDYVQTRKGLRRVLVSRCNGFKQTYVVELTNSIRLQGTAEHPIWVQDFGWKPLKNLSINDKIATWENFCSDSEILAKTQNARSWNFKALGSTDTRKAASRRTVNIINRISMRVLKALKRCTSRYGNLLMGDCLKVGKYTTKTTTLLTTTRRIWKQCLDTIMPSCIRSCDLARQSVLLNWHAFSLYPERGIPPQKVGNGIANTPYGPWQTAKHTPDVVISVESNTTINSSPANIVRITAHSGFAKTYNSIQFPAVALFVRRFFKRNPNLKGNIAVSRVEHETQRVLSTSSGIVLRAGSRLKGLWGESVFAPQSVVAQVSESNVAPVFNLQVEGQPEYFANGLLVHNCMMLFYDSIPKAAPLTDAERITVAMPAQYRYEALQAKRPEMKGLLPEDEMTYLVARDEAKKVLKIVGGKRDGFGNLVED